MQWWLGHTRPVRVLLIAAVASGCATPVALWRPVPPPEPSIVQTGSDRLRDRSAQPPPSEIRGRDRPAAETPTSIPAPPGTREPPQPQQPVRPLEAPQPSPPDEPDPRAV